MSKTTKDFVVKLPQEDYDEIVKEYAIKEGYTPQIREKTELIDNPESAEAYLQKRCRSNMIKPLINKRAAIKAKEASRKEQEELSKKYKV